MYAPVPLVRVVVPVNVTLPSPWIVTRPTLFAAKVPVRKKNVTLPLNVAVRVANDKLVMVTRSTSAPRPPRTSEATPARTVIVPTGGGPAGFGFVVEIWFSTIVSLIACFRRAWVAAPAMGATQPMTETVNNRVPIRLKAPSATLHTRLGAQFLPMLLISDRHVCARRSSGTGVLQYLCAEQLLRAAGAQGFPACGRRAGSSVVGEAFTLPHPLIRGKGQDDAGAESPAPARPGQQEGTASRRVALLMPGGSTSATAVAPLGVGE